MNLNNYKTYKGVYVREGLAVDKNMVRDCFRHYDKFGSKHSLKDAVVMDWGMNIGGFGHMMLQEPIKQYIGIEPHPDNFEVAKANLAHDPRSVLIQAAVTNEPVDSIELHLTNSKQSYCSGTINLKSKAAASLRQTKIDVPTKQANELMDKYKPTHFKCDIEGEEYRIFDSWNWKFPECVKEMAVEFHWQDKALSYEDGWRSKILDNGFHPVYENLNYVKGDTEFTWQNSPASYRNIWGIDCFYEK
jgi:FkbM family methyltransferase